MTKWDECVLLCATTATTIKDGAKQTTNANFTHKAPYTAFLYWAMFRTFSWLGCSWTGSSAWTWWYLRVRKIFVYDASEITKQRGIVMRRYKKVIRSSSKAHKEETRDKIQMVATMIYVRFKVTICLYLSPNNRARSLYTLMAVIVIKDAKNNAEPVM